MVVSVSTSAIVELMLDFNDSISASSAAILSYYIFVFSLLEKYGFDNYDVCDNDTKLLSVMTRNDYPPDYFFQEMLISAK